MQSYKFRNKVYTITPCTKEDIPSHLERVLPYYAKEDIEIQKDRMHMAVYNGTAFKLVDEEGTTHTFLYYEQLDEKNVIGIALWWSYLRLFFIFGRWFRPIVQIEYIHVEPHNKSFIPFAFLTDDYFIEEYEKGNGPLAFHLWSKGCEKIRELIDKMNLEEL